VTWSTLNQTTESRALVGRKRFEKEYIGTATRFVDGGPEGRSQYIHTVTMTGLEPETYYLYRVGSSQAVLWIRIRNNANVLAGSESDKKFGYGIGFRHCCRMKICVKNQKSNT
jgi:hypothetical protein